MRIFPSPFHQTAGTVVTLLISSLSLRDGVPAACGASALLCDAGSDFNFRKEGADAIQTALPYCCCPWAVLCAKT